MPDTPEIPTRRQVLTSAQIHERLRVPSQRGKRMNKTPRGLKTIAREEWLRKQAILKAEQAAIVAAKNAAFIATIKESK